MESSLDLWPESFSQCDLERLAATNPDVQHLHLALDTEAAQDADAAGAGLDFTAVRLPALRSLSLEGVPLAGLVLDERNVPALESLSVSRPPRGLSKLMLALPELAQLSLEGVALLADGGSDRFAPSLAQCPKLKSITLVEMSGLGGYHFFSLPACEFFYISAHDVKAIDVYGPRLLSLSLSCLGLTRLRFHDSTVLAPAEARAFRAEANALDQVKGEVTDAEVDAILRRCRRRGADEDDDEEEEEEEDEDADDLRSGSGSSTDLGALSSIASGSEEGEEAPPPRTLQGQLSVHLLGTTRLSFASLAQLQARVGADNIEGSLLGSTGTATGTGGHEKDSGGGGGGGLNPPCLRLDDLAEALSGITTSGNSVSSGRTGRSSSSTSVSSGARSVPPAHGAKGSAGGGSGGSRSASASPTWFSAPVSPYFASGGVGGYGMGRGGE